MSALSSLYQSLKARLDNQGVWGRRVFADFAPAGTPYPYCVYAMTSGSRPLTVRRQDFESSISICTIASEQVQAFTGDDQIVALIDNQGFSDRGVVRGDNTPFWILTITRETQIHIVDLVDGRNVYQEGGIYRIRMEIRGA